MMVILIGGGTHARVILNILNASAIKTIGYIAPLETELSDFVTYLGDDELLKSKKNGSSSTHLIAFSFYDKKSQRNRNRFLERSKYKLNLSNFVSHPTAYFGQNVTIGKGSVVCTRAVINDNTVIGEDCVINTGAIIEHDCLIGDHCHIAPGAIVCGNSEIKAHSLIGAGSVVINSSIVNLGSIIKAGEVYRNDLNFLEKK